jgi:hypothetical protein
MYLSPFSVSAMRGEIIHRVFARAIRAQRIPHANGAAEFGQLRIDFELLQRGACGRASPCHILFVQDDGIKARIHQRVGDQSTRDARADDGDVASDVRAAAGNRGPNRCVLATTDSHS